MEQRFSPLETSNSTAKTDLSTEKLKDLQLPSTSSVKPIPEITQLFVETAAVEPPKKLSTKPRKAMTEDSKDLLKSTLERNVGKKLSSHTHSIASSSPWMDRKISDCSELSARSVRSNDSISGVSDNSFVVIRDRKVFAAWETQLGRAEANEITLHSGPKSIQPHQQQPHKPLVYSTSLDTYDIPNIDEDSDDVTGLLSTVKLSPRRGSKVELKPLPKAPSPDAAKSAGKQRSKRCKSETKSGKTENRLPPLNTEKSEKPNLADLGTQITPATTQASNLNHSQRHKSETSKHVPTTDSNCEEAVTLTASDDDPKIPEDLKVLLLPDVASNRWQKFRQWSLPGLTGMIRPRGLAQSPLAEQKGDGQLLVSSTEVPTSQEAKIVAKKNPYYQRLIRSKTVASEFSAAAAEQPTKVEVGGKRARQRKLEDSISPSRREKRFFSQTRMASPTTPSIPSFKEIMMISSREKKNGAKPKSSDLIVPAAKVTPTKPSNKPSKSTGKKKSDFSQSCFPSLTGKHRGSDTESLLSYREADSAAPTVGETEVADDNANHPDIQFSTVPNLNWKDVKMVHQGFFNGKKLITQSPLIIMIAKTSGNFSDFDDFFSE